METIEPSNVDEAAETDLDLDASGSPPVTWHDDLPTSGGHRPGLC
jgi:hypothetical protein